MPQFIFYALVATGVYMSVKWLKNESKKLNRRPARKQASNRRAGDKNVTTLEQDPKTGIYKPADE